VLGPGQFSFSSVSDGDTGGTHYQAAPIDDGFETTSANLSTDATYEATVGMVDAETPIVAMSDRESVFYRVFGGGNPNDESAWKPIVRADAGQDPHLASGPRGTFLMNLTAGANRKYVLRKFDAGTQSFAPPIDVTTPTDPTFGQLHEDQGGNLHLIWRGANGELHYRSSVDGATLTPDRTIADSSDGDISGMAVGAGADGKGWAVWEDGTGGVSGPLRAVRIDASAAPGGGPPPPACSNNIRFGVAIAFAVAGCFTTTDKNTYVATGPVRVNGVDLTPVPGAEVTTRINRKQRTLKTSGAMTVALGRVVLDRRRIDWELPEGTNVKVDAFKGAGDFGSGLLGFPVSGEAELNFLKGGKAELPVNLKLPEEFWDGTTGRTVLTASNKGIDLSNVGIDIPKFNLALLGIGEFGIEYLSDNPFTFKGTAALQLPPGWGLKADFTIEDGELAEAGASLTPPTPIVIVPPVFLKSIDFRIHAKPKPTTLQGGADLTAGPTIGGTAAVEVDGTLTYTFPDPGPAVIQVDAAVLIAGLDIGQGRIRYASNGVFSVGGKVSLNFDVVSVTGGFSGFVDIPRSAVQLGANVDVQAFGYKSGGDFIASTKGIGTCATVFPEIDVGFTYVYGHAFTPMVFSCSLADVIEDKPPGALRAAQAGAGREVTIDAGHPGGLIMVDGADSAPRLRVTAPDGSTIESTPDGKPVVAGKLKIASLDETKRTFVHVGGTGAYKVETLPGSVPIAKVSHGYDFRPVKVSAKVRGKGRKRVLTYSARGLVPGTHVTFSEMGVKGGGGSPPAGAVIGRAKGRTGRIAFKPGPGPGGRRNIVALVEQGDVPVSDDRVAGYVAPAPVEPGKPKHVRVKLSGRSLKVSWARARNAKLNRVRVALKRDGRIVQVQTKKPSLLLRGVDAPDVATISVLALRPVEGTQSGKARAKVKLKKKPKRRR
jgi:hypothetical protein